MKVTGKEAYLSNLMVALPHRRKGLGADILGKVMIEARRAGAEELILDVDTMNSPAVNLYKKCGFEILQRREKSYPRGEDAFVMRRPL